MTYDAWGNPTVCEETVPNRFRFNGQQYDPVSQQYYLRARYYNPVIGRFTQEDTNVQAATETGHRSSSQEGQLAIRMMP